MWRKCVGCALLIGCGAAPDNATVEPCRDYSEVTFALPAAPFGSEAASPRDLVLVVEPELRPRVEDLVLSIVDGAVRPTTPQNTRLGPSGDTDPYHTRVTVIDEATLGTLLSSFSKCNALEPGGCESIDLIEADYDWVPYGYGSDYAQFAAALTCLLSGTGECADVKHSLSQSFFSPERLSIVWFTDSDVCATPSAACTDLMTLSTWTEIQLPTTLELMMVAAVPESLVHDVLVDGAIDQSVLLHDPALPAAGQPVPCGMRSNAPVVPRNLIANLGASVWLASLCSAQADPAIANRIESMLGVSTWTALRCSGPFTQLETDVRGLVPCTLVETLPKTGPITHCAQLEGHGRNPIPVSTSDGVETCAVIQVPAPGVDPPSTTHGFFVAQQTDMAGRDAGYKPGCVAQENVARFWVPIDFTFIYGSGIAMRCTGTDTDSCP